MPPIYYPFNLGKVKIWSQYKKTFEAQPIWQINVRLSDIKFRRKNPFALSLANNIVGKPSLKFNDRLEKESIIRKIFNETGYTERDAKNTVNALHNIMDDLYTNADDRFVYELLQNADDQPQEGKSVNVFMQLLDSHLLFMHDGRPFDNDDVDSICSIGSSTKREKKEKIGYKGIGFKSVFTGSDTVIVNSGNFSFAFDKYSALYNDSSIENIPWQLKPIWQEKYRYPKEVRNNEYFWKSQVGISLDIDSESVNYYDSSIIKILSSPLFLLFLKNVYSFRFLHDKKDLKISKIQDGYITHLKRNEDIISSWLKVDFVIDIPQEVREAMQNDRNVPQKMKEATKTQISFATLITNGQVGQLNNSVLYAYLPTSVNDFKFNFIVNADFLLAANREQLHVKKLWNQFLFQKIGSLLIDWCKSISAFTPTYLNLLPLTQLPEEETGHLTLSPYFNSSYRSAIESEAFIVNHKGELAKQEEIIIDKTGLSEIVGAYLFCQLLKTEKYLPSEKIDSKILEEDIFEYIEVLGFDDVIEAITSNSKFNDWFVSATDEQKAMLYKWIEDNNIRSRKDGLESFVANLPLFLFGQEYKSCEEVESLDNIITTEHIEPIRNVLSKLGFTCSENLFDENHPLYEFIDLTDEEDLFNSIKEADFSGLTTNERKKLFLVLANFDGIGDAKLKKDIALFKNMKGEFKPLEDLIAYRDNAPVWLHEYILCKDDYDAYLTKYIIAQEDEFEDIVQKNIEDIVQKNIEDIDTIWAELYKAYKDNWTGQFTRHIIDSYEIGNDILSIIEESDTKTKAHFLDSIEKLDLHSSLNYKKDSYEYRVLKLALDVYSEPSEFSSKIFYDDTCIENFTVSDEVLCEFQQDGSTKKIKLSLAKLLPQYQDKSDIVGKIKNSFEVKTGIDKFFKVSPLDHESIRKGISKFLGSDRGQSRWPCRKGGNAYQYLFYTYYYRQEVGYTSSWVWYIDLEDETDDFVKEMCDFLFENKISIKTSPFTYRLHSYFINKFFDSQYLTDDERLLSTIENWADTDEKRIYLKNNGVKTENSNTIQFRKLFIENEPIDFIYRLENEDLISGIKFITTATSLERPFVGENQKNVLLSLKEKIRGLSGNWNECLMNKNAKEWDTKEYKDWIIDRHDPQIFIYPGMLPCQLSYEDEILLHYDDSEYDYYYNVQEKKLFVSNARKIEDILFEVAKEGDSRLDFDDYKELCLEGKISISKEDIEKKDKTIESLSEENRKKDEIIEQYRAKYGELTSGDNDTSNDEVPQDIETNDVLNIMHKNSQDEIDHQSGKVIERDQLSHEEQIAAHKEAADVIKEQLEKDGYDCSNWKFVDDDDDSSKKWNSFNQVDDIISPKGETINLVIKSVKGGYIYLSAIDFEYLTSSSNNVLMVWDGTSAHSVTAEDIFNKDSNVNLIFDTEYTPKHYYAALSRVFQYIKRTTFAVKNPRYNATDTIKSFGMDSKTEGVQKLFDDNDL